MYGAIVVPVDGSEFAERALPLAASLARAAGARVELVQVREPLGVEGGEAWMEAVREQDGRYLSALAEGLRAEGVPAVATHLLEGPVAVRLEDHLERSGVDLVILSTHGHGLLSRAWLGSVADRLIRSSNVPVLLVRPAAGERRGARDIADFRHVLVPVDGSAESERVLAPVLELTRLAGGEITLLHVVEEPVPTGMIFLPRGVRDRDELVQDATAAARRYLADLAERLRAEGVPIRTELTVGDAPATVILEQVRGGPADLVAMSTHGRGGLKRAVLGSVTDKVVRASAKPILVVSPAVAAEA